jgi:hypothetical protein
LLFSHDLAVICKQLSKMPEVASWVKGAVIFVFSKRICYLVLVFSNRYATPLDCVLGYRK